MCAEIKRSPPTGLVRLVLIGFMAFHEVKQLSRQPFICPKLEQCVPFICMDCLVSFANCMISIAEVSFLMQFFSK